MKRSEMIKSLASEIILSDICTPLPNFKEAQEFADIFLTRIEEAGMLPPIKKSYETLWWNDPTKSVDCQVEEAFAWESEDE